MSRIVSLLLLVFALGATSWSAEAPPPRPVPPVRSAVPAPSTRAERDAAEARWMEQQKKWRDDVKSWEAALTPAQKAALQQQEQQEAAKRRAESDRRQRLPRAADGYAWRDDATARKLPAATVERLGRDKLAYGATVKQSFEPYLHGPVFITSDSLLNAFHVLFEDTFRAYEVRQAGELRRNLEGVLQQARENLRKSTFPATDTAPAWRHVQVVMGPALRLLGSGGDLFDADVQAEIEIQLAKIRAASAVELPSWLAPAERELVAVDYRACKPVGFYAGDEKLSDYFRAVRWLQLVPFRAEREVELAAIGMLGYGLNQAYRTVSQAYFRAYAEVLGVTDARGLPEASYDFQNFFLSRAGETWTAALVQKQRWILRGVMSSDALRAGPRNELPAGAPALLARLRYHVLPAHRLWDSALFQKLADAQLEPEGLAVAMMLGSAFARSQLERLTPAQVEAAARAAEPERGPDAPRPAPTLYEGYLTALRTLHAAPAAEAPAFMRGPAWQAKTTQTVLSAWAQMRHTFTLQAKRSEHYFGMTLLPPGFVEPNPEFFARMADVIERARTLFAANRDEWDELASVTRKLEALAHKQLRQQPWSAEDEGFLKGYGARLAGVMGYRGNSYLTPLDDAPRWTEVHYSQPKASLLAVAVGRPRVIYVLYPWQGIEILCQGAVMPYHEYWSKERLTDPEWKQLLDSARAPAQPAWLQPYVREAP